MLNDLILPSEEWQTGTDEDLCYCNTTQPWSPEYTEQFQVSDTCNSEINCHSLKNTVYPVFEIQYISGYSRSPLTEIAKHLTESGILGMYDKFTGYVRDLAVNRKIEIKKSKESTEVRPFEIKDLKILSIFIAWAVLLAAAFLVFLMELTFNSIIKRCRSRSQTVAPDILVVQPRKIESP